jgi:hypothetical protein
VTPVSPDKPTRNGQYIMKNPIRWSLLGVLCLALASAPAFAEVLTVNSILTAQKAGAPSDGMVAMVNNPSNSVGMSAGDLVTLRNAGVSENVIAAVWARVPTPAPTPVPLTPDDARLVDLVRLIKSGISESIVAEQVKQDARPYDLSVNDLLYLKQNGVGESTIGALMAKGAAAPVVPVAGVAPESISFDDLVMKSTMKRDRPGRLVMHGDSLAWTDANDPERNFEFKTTGLEKVWFTCQARTPDSFCYQINFQVVKGARYQFQDRNRESGSNAAVLKVMDALRTHFPQIVYGSPKS